MTQKNHQLGLFVDFEALAAALDNLDAESSKNFSIAELLSYLQKNYGRVVFRRAYADWNNSKLRKGGQDLQRNGVEMQHVLRGGGYGKNAVESFMSLQALEVLGQRADISAVALLSGDADFPALVSRIKSSGRQIVGIGSEGGNSATQAKLCDDYIFLTSKGFSHRAPVQPEKGTVITQMKELIGSNGVLLSELEAQVRERMPDFSPADFGCGDLAEFLQGVSAHIKMAETEEGVVVSWSNSKNASPYTTQELQNFNFQEYMQATRWYIEDGNIRDRVLHNIYALFEDGGRVLTNEELRNLVDPEHIVEDRPWYGTIFSLVYGACLWENPDSSDLPLPRHRLSLFRTVKSEEEFLIRYYTSLFHKAFSERPDITPRMCAELMHPEDVDGHVPLYEQVLAMLSQRH